MDFIFDFLQNILDLLSNFFTWVGSLILDLVNLATQVWRMVTLIPAFFAWLPEYITVPLIAGFSIVAVYKILGREG